jgi:RHS repeat-associated protein
MTNYYVYGNGLLYEIDVTGSTTSLLYYHFDVRGSTIALTDPNGNLTDQFEYSPYGTETYHAGTNITPFLYNARYGVQTDNNGLLFMKARYYNPYICRFLNPDPSGFSGGLNLYQFASGNPVCQVDPTGFGAISANTSQASWISGSTPNNSMYANGTPVNPQNPFGVSPNSPSTGQLFGNGLNNTVTAIGQTIGQGLYDLTHLQFSTDQYNQIANTMYSTATPANPAATPYVEAALGVSGAATAIAGGTIAWEAAGLPTMNVAVGQGVPFHVAYGVGSTWVNAVGSSFGSMTVSTYLASDTAAGAYFTVTGIPVLNSAAVVATGGAAWTCVTAAGSAFVRGWIP